MNGTSTTTTQEYDYLYQNNFTNATPGWPCADLGSDFKLFEFWSNGVLLNLVGILGILGNVLSMIILSRPQMRSSINYLLIGLARCDTVLIVMSILLFGIPAIHPHTGYLRFYYLRIVPAISEIGFFIALSAQTASVSEVMTVRYETFMPPTLFWMWIQGRTNMDLMRSFVVRKTYNTSWSLLFSTPNRFT